MYLISSMCKRIDFKENTEVFELKEIFTKKYYGNGSDGNGSSDDSSSDDSSDDSGSSNYSEDGDCKDESDHQNYFNSVDINRDISSENQCKEKSHCTKSVRFTNINGTDSTDSTDSTGSADSTGTDSTHSTDSIAKISDFTNNDNTNSDSNDINDTDQNSNNKEHKSILKNPLCGQRIVTENKIEINEQKIDAFTDWIEIYTTQLDGDMIDDYYKEAQHEFTSKEQLFKENHIYKINDIYLQVEAHSPISEFIGFLKFLPLYRFLANYNDRTLYANTLKDVFIEKKTIYGLMILGDHFGLWQWINPQDSIQNMGMCSFLQDLGPYIILDKKFIELCGIFMDRLRDDLLIKST